MKFHCNKAKPKTVNKQDEKKRSFGLASSFHDLLIEPMIPIVETTIKDPTKKRGNKARIISFSRWICIVHLAFRAIE